MKVLLSGIIGASLGAALWLGLENLTGMNLGWLACVVGVITGLCVHWAAGPDADSSFGRGALATVLALAAIVSGPQVYLMTIASRSDTVGLGNAAVSTAVTSSASTGEDGEDVVTDSLPTRTPSKTRLSEGKRTIGTTGVKLTRSLSEIQMLWMCIAALAAYVLGKGRDQVSPTMLNEEESPDDMESTSPEEGE